MPHFLIAPDSFKESLTATEAAEAIARGIQRASPDSIVDLCPMADGGEGTVEALLTATDGERKTTRVHGPLGELTDATWGIFQPKTDNRKSAILEMSSAAGLHLVPLDQRDPTRTTTYGVGELIIAALDAGAKRIILGIGGSATNDGGAGMAQAIGVKFSQANGEPCVCGLAGGGLTSINTIDMQGIDPRIADCEIIIACDVTNPLCGTNGAAHVYAPQKGATLEQVKQLDTALQRLADTYSREQTCSRNLADQPGAGAAGGLGFGLMAFTGAKLARGIELIMDAVNFDHRAKQADLVVTGEGKLDGQSIQGKTCIGIAQRAAGVGTPTIALVGCADDDADLCLQHGLKSYHPICDGTITREQAMQNAARLLEELTTCAMQ